MVARLSFIYLASPYSHADPAVMVARYEAACKRAAELMTYGHAVFSPIAHSHPIADHLPPDARTSFEFWMTQDLPLLRYAKELVVLCLDGWKESRGVTREIEFAKALDIPIRYI